MMASLTADQEIDQAIERLQKKMQAVSDNIDRGRNYKKSSQKRVKSRTRPGKNKSSLKRLLKYLFIFILLGATSFVVALIATGYIKSLENVGSTETAETKQNGLTNEVKPQQPIADISQATEKASPAAPAKFSMQAANYNIVESELGPVLDIAITVANIGEESGRPKLFEIELVDDANNQLMKWPMAASGASISPQQEMVYKTRLIEPPEDFKNIRVTMKK